MNPVQKKWYVKYNFNQIKYIKEIIIKYSYQNFILIQIKQSNQVNKKWENLEKQQSLNNLESDREFDYKIKNRFDFLNIGSDSQTPKIIYMPKRNITNRAILRMYKKRQKNLQAILLCLFKEKFI